MTTASYIEGHVGTRLGGRPFRLLREQRGDVDLVRVVFAHDGQARYYLDPAKSVVVEDSEGKLWPVAYSEDAFVMQPARKAHAPITVAEDPTTSEEERGAA